MKTTNPKPVAARTTPNLYYSEAKMKIHNNNNKQLKNTPLPVACRMMHEGSWLEEGVTDEYGEQQHRWTKLMKKVIYDFEGKRSRNPIRSR